MSLTNDLGKIAPRHAEIAQRKLDSVKAFHAAVAPYVDHARAAIPKLNHFIANEIQPVIAQCRRFRIRDGELNRWLFELTEGICKKPGELQMHLDGCARMGWEDLRQIVYPNLVDEAKRDALVRHYRQVLTKYGDVERDARSAILRINERARFLAENCGRADLRELPLHPPGDGPDKLTVLDNLPHD